MSFLSRLFGSDSRTRDPLRPLWHRTVEIAREKHWYAKGGIADTVAGRFDAITLVLSLVLIRLERDKTLMEPAARLTEIFVEDMDGQLREEGVGDPTVGKHVGKLMKALGGRLGALRGALPQGQDALLPVIKRNVTLIDGADPYLIAGELRALMKDLEDTSNDALLAGRISRR